VAVRFPTEFRFEGSEVFVRRDPKTGDVILRANLILSRKPDSWDGLYSRDQIPGDSMDTATAPMSREPIAICERHAKPKT